jgi:maltose O-acetyltransferase
MGAAATDSSADARMGAPTEGPAGNDRAPSQRIQRALRSLLLKAVVPRAILPGGMRPELLRRCGMRIGAGTTVRSGCRIRYGRVSLGPGCYVNFGVTFDDTAPIVLEDNVVIAFESAIVTGSHELGDRQRRAGPALPAPVRIGSGCWLGARVIVLPGVTIGPGCMIAAGAVVRTTARPMGSTPGCRRAACAISE